MSGHISERTTVLQNMSAPPRSKVNFRVLVPAQSDNQSSGAGGASASNSSGLICRVTIDMDALLGLKSTGPGAANQGNRLIGIVRMLIEHLADDRWGLKWDRSKLEQLPVECLHDAALEMAQWLPKPDLPMLGIFGGTDGSFYTQDTVLLLHVLTHANGNTYTRDAEPLLPDLAGNFRHGLWVPVQK